MVGIGYDSHRFADGRPLILGGVEIDHPQGLEGHSDADVLTHAVIDAILGAARRRRHRHALPARGRAWRGADSIDLLRTAIGTIAGRVVNVDATVICEAPKLGPYKPQMEQLLGEATSAPGHGQGDDQRGDGLDRARRGHRLHRRRPGRGRLSRAAVGTRPGWPPGRSANSLHDSMASTGTNRRAGGRLRPPLRGAGAARGRDRRADASRQGAAGRLAPSCAGAPRRRPASPPRRSSTRTRSRSSTNAAR